MRQILTDALCRTKPPRTGRLEIADLRQADLVLLQGKEVIALTADTATIRNPATGNVTVYRKYKPAYGPL